MIENPSYVNGKSRQTGTRWLHHIYAWLELRAKKNPHNINTEVAHELKEIVHERYESETGRDAKTGLPKAPA